MSFVIIQAAAPWEIKHKGIALHGVGKPALLSVPMVACFASRQCPGAAIRAATDWALAQAGVRQAVIGGFHSPLEQSVLQLLIQARSPVVAVLARPLTGAKLLPVWEAAITAGHLAVISAVTTPSRLTGDQAARRNDLAAQLSDSIVVAYASAGGGLFDQSGAWLKQGKSVKQLVT